MNEATIKPLVSIALCTYNGAHYLREQLDSLLAQTCRDFELIAVDDCSTDSTLVILNEYAARDSRLQVHANPANIGLSGNFEVALQRCSGTYIAPCDQDDIWSVDKLTVLLNVIGEHAAAYCNSELIDAAGNTLDVTSADLCSMLTTADPAAFIFANCASGHAMLFRREILDVALPIPTDFFHDWWLAAVAAARGGIVFCNRSLVRYRQHASNVTDMMGVYKTSRDHRLPGHRCRQLREVGRRIDLLSALPGVHQEFFRELNRLWTARESQWLSFGLASFMARNGARVYATRKNVTRLFRLRRSLSFLIGLRTKRWMNGHDYLP